MSSVEFRLIRLPRWVIVLAVSLLVALGLTLVVIAAGLFLIVFPVVLALAAAAAIIGPRRGRGAPGRQIRVIEADYIVHEDRSGPHDHDRRRG